MAVADDPAVSHGPLELLFTVSEETGLNGAAALAIEGFQGRQLLNLDSEELGVLYVGCAGGRAAMQGSTWTGSGPQLSNTSTRGSATTSCQSVQHSS